MKKSLVLISIVTLLIVVTSICLFACTSIKKDPQEQAKDLEDKGCTVELYTEKADLQEVADELADMGIIIINDLEAYIHASKDGKEGFIFYTGSLGDAETISEFYSTYSDYNSMLQDNRRVFIGDKEIYNCLEK